MNTLPTPPSCALLITTYNWPQALDRCLASVMHQNVLPAEILIADDGSGPQTAELIEQWQQKSPVPLRHIWHPDEGFRLSEIRNKAIVAASQPYIIQIDGDILLQTHFIQDHLQAAREGVFLCGSRASLSAQVSRKLLQDSPRLPMLHEIPPGYLFNSVRLPLISRLFARFFKVNQVDRLRGCNMSFWKTDLLKVNGYNQDMMGWGPEDKEIAVRLINSGVQKRNLKFLAVAYHLFHKSSDRQKAEENRALLQQAFINNHKQAKNGIYKLQ